MSTSFASVIFLLGILTGQIVCPSPPPTEEASKQNSKEPENNVQDSQPDENKKESQKEEPNEQQNEETEENAEKEGKKSDENETTDDEDAEKDPLLPSLSCMLFEDDTVCNSMCSIMSTIYGNPIFSGTCQEDDNCKCSEPSNTSLDDLWKAKFDSDNILQDISKNKNLSEKILDVLKIPFRTSQQTIQDLKSMLPTRQLKKLRLKDNSAQKLLGITDEEFDKTAIQKYVAKTLKSSGTTLPSSNDSKENLINMLEVANAGDVFVHIVRLVTNSENQVLNGVLNTYLEQNRIEYYPHLHDSPQTLVEVLEAALVNEIIKPPPGKKRSNKKSESNSTSVDTLKSTNPAWNLRGFDKKQVAAHKKGKKCWQSVNFHVCLTKTESLTILYWENKDPRTWIKIEVESDGSIYQHWIYNHNGVEIDQNSKGQSEQSWSFGKSGFFITKYSDGTTNRRQWFGNEDLEDLRRYKHFIDTWCEHNDYLIGHDNCVIY